MTTILDTERLALRELNEEDAGFVLELLNESGWLRFIGDLGIRTEEAAREYIAKGPMAMYHRLGFGLYAVARKSDGALLGMCGLIKLATHSRTWTSASHFSISTAARAMRSRRRMR
jgi:RimJ/RimL family protein N-acetyltransferase